MIGLWAPRHSGGRFDTLRIQKLRRSKYLAHGTRLAMPWFIMSACLLAAVPSLLASALFVATLKLRGSRPAK